MFKKFSHIYIENDIIEDKPTKDIIKKFPNSEIIIIDDYKSFFNRPNQNFLLQKQSQKLILANKKDNFIYKGSEIIQNFGYKNLHYVPFVFNCIYDCSYCYLQGMYNSANIVLFVNIDDYLNFIDTIQEEFYLCVSYDTDLLAFENIFHYCKKIIEYAKLKPNITIEIRTKSNNFKSLATLDIPNNIIFAWSLAPQNIIDKYEKNTPNINQRLKSIKKAIDKNCRVRLSFEPIFITNNYLEQYEELFEIIFSQIDSKKIDSINLDMFRIGQNYFKKISKIREEIDIFYKNYEIKNNLITYPDEITKITKTNLLNLLSKYIEKEKIFI